MSRTIRYAVLAGLSAIALAQPAMATCDQVCITTPIDVKDGGQCDAAIDINCTYTYNGVSEQCDVWKDGSCYLDVT